MRVLVLFTFLLFTTSYTKADVPNKDLHLKCLYPTVKIIQTPSGNGGSGVIVRSTENVDKKFTNVVITAAHSAKSELDVYVPKYTNWSTIIDYSKYKGVVVALHDGYDLAIVIFVSPDRMYTADIDFDTPFYIGSEIVKIGYGLRDEARLDKGEITSVKFVSDDIFKDCLRMNAETTAGDSGGPIFLKSTNKVIGINRGMRMWGQEKISHHAFASPISLLKKWSAESGNSLDYVFNKQIALTIDLDKSEKEYKIALLIIKLMEIDQDINFKTILRGLILDEIKGIESGRGPIMPEVDLGADAPTPPK